MQHSFCRQQLVAGQTDSSVRQQLVAGQTAGLVRNLGLRTAADLALSALLSSRAVSISLANEIHR